MGRPASRARAWTLLIITILVALLAGGAIFAILGRGPALLAARPRPGDVTGSPAIRPDLNGVAGVNLDAGELSAPDLPFRLAALDAAGIRWVRIRMPWDQIEPGQGQFRWGAWDRVFAALKEHPSLEPLLVLDGSPEWARPPEDSKNPLAPPQTRADFGAFASAVARRYGGQIRYYQIWDEPNIAPHWGARPVDAASYVGLLREGAAQIRGADPDSRIVAAALAPNFEAGGANQSDVEYLDGIYKAGGRRWFDVVAAQPYGFSHPASDRPHAGTLNFGRAALLRDVMLRYGDAETPVWATAFGWNALPSGWTGRPSPWGEVSEAEQAQYTADALALARSQWSWLGPLFWATNCPPADGQGAREAGDPWRGFSLCGKDGARRPAWNALVAAARPSEVLPPGDHPVDHTALHYSAGWRVTPAGADPSANGDRLDFTFYGTDLALRVQGGPFWAYDTLTVDGQAANALPRDESGAAYLALSDPLGEVRTVPVAKGLQPGNHRVALEARGGWDQWALQGVLVSVSRPGLPLAGWLLALGLALALWAVVAWPWRRPAGLWLALAEGMVGRRAPALTWGLAIALGIALMLSTHLALDLVLLLALGVLFLLCPELMLPLIAAGIPFWPHPKPVLRWQFAPAEIFLWLGTATLATRWVLTRASIGSAQAGGRNGAGVSAGSGAGWRSALERTGLHGFDWPVLALLLAGIASAATAQHLGVALRELRVVFVDGALFYLVITRILGQKQGASPARDITPNPSARRRGEPESSVTPPSLAEKGAGPLVPPTRSAAGRGGLPAPKGSREGLGLRSPITRPSFWPLLDGLLAGMLAVSAVALWQLLTGQGRIDVEGVWRVRAFYGSPNNLALVLDRMVPLATAIALFSSTGRVRRWVYGLSALAMALACIATFSKGALLLGLPLGVGLVAVAGAWRARQRRPLLALCAAAVAGALVLGVLFQTQRFADLTNFQTGTSFIRLKLWQSALHMALDHPWLGVGPDNFLYAYRTRYVLPSAWEELNLSHPHNILLDLWTRLGVLGFIAGAWALGAGLVRSWQLFRRGSRSTWPVALGLLGGLVATAGHGLIDNSLFLTDLMALFMLALALLQVMPEFEQAAPAESPAPSRQVERAQAAHAAMPGAAAPRR